LIRNEDDEDISSQVLQHLEDGLDALRQSWGLAEWSKIEHSFLDDLSPRMQEFISSRLYPTSLEILKTKPLASLGDHERNLLIEELGRASLTESYRQLILSVISSLWIDYLTEMEALRVSIGLEAYAQRDPLVQYKNKSYELFQQLISNVRLGVISRMFTYRPRTMKVAVSLGENTERIQSGVQIQTAETVKQEVVSAESRENEGKLPAKDYVNAETGSRSQKRRRNRR
jgi:preprotein translocase subunit SecA